MHKVLLLGAGKIGRMIARFLATSGDYDLVVADADAGALKRLRAQTKVETVPVDAADRQQLAAAMKGRKAVISALSYVNNPLVAQVALECGASYFDLTEDIETTRIVKEIAQTAKAGQ